MADQLNAIVSARLEVSPGLIILRVTPDGWEIPEFHPGQFAVLALPGRARRYELSSPEEDPPDPDKLIKRAYSISSASLVHEFIEFYIVLLPSGALTPRLFALDVGDRVWLGPKVSGLFTLDDVPPDMNVVLISTGTGLAPYMSMIRSRLALADGRRVAVLQGARHSWDLGYHGELITLTNLSRGQFIYVPTISRPAEEPINWRGHTGHVQDLWASRPLEKAWGFPPAPENTHVFLCGNPGMIEEMEVLLKEEGYAEHSRKSPGQIHVEKYW